jgi:surface antigen
MLGGHLRWAGLAASALALGVLAAPAQAQFGGIVGGALRGGANAATNTDTNGCPKGRKRSAGSRIAGGILGGAASSAAGRAGGVFYYVPVSTFTDTITASIACKLDPEEQKQAAEATLEATRSAEEDATPEVGSTAAWTSNTREAVSGTSTVVASNDSDNSGLHCITVTDVIIVSGEETRADKRMCRRPPARYTLAA